MADTGGVGDLTITVGGDLTPLETALASVPEAFAGLTSAAEDAFAGLGASLDTVTADIANLASAAAAAAAPITDLGEQLDLFAAAPLAELPEVGEQLQLFATYAGEASSATEALTAEVEAAAPSMANLADNTEQTDSSLSSLIANVGGGLLTFQALKSALEDMATAYGEVQRAQIALGSLLGNTAQAQAAISSVQSLANSLGLASAAAVEAQQKLIAIGEPLQAIPGDLTAIADGAAAMNTSFETAAQRFDQITNSGSLMQRSLTSIGLSVQSVGAAMGEAGVPAADLTKQFQLLDEQQRAAILSSAELAQNAGVAAAAASGVAGSWNQVANAVTAAFQEMGKQVNGFQGLATAAVTSIQFLEDVFTELVGVIKQVDNALVVLAGLFTTAFAGIGQVVSDALTGNLKAIPGDVQATTTALQSYISNFLQETQKDWTDTSNAIAGIWSSGMGTVASSSQTAGAAVAGAAQQVNVLQLAAQNAQKNFTAVAAAFAAGRVSAAQYTDALNALNTAQENANGGLEQASTALLIAANNYRQVAVDAANAKTDVDAIGQLAAAGAVSWTAYDAALKQLDTDQKNANSGLQDSHTALLLAQEDLQNLGVIAANAQTALTAIVTVYGAAALGTKAYTDALNALQSAETNAAQGVINLGTAIQQSANIQAQANLEWKNADIALQAAYQYYIQTGQGVQQLIDLTLKLANAQTNANNGIESYLSAQQKIIAQNTQFQNSLTNANTDLAAATQQLADGTIGLGTYQKYVDAAKTAQDALNGSTQTAAASAKAATTAQAGLTSTVQSAGAPTNNLTYYWENVNGALEAVATTYTNMNGTLVVSTSNLTQNSEQAQQVVTTTMNLNGTLVTSSTNLTNAAASTDKLTTSYQNLNGTMVVTTSDLKDVANAASQVGTAAAAAASQVQSLGSELDKTTNAQIGDLSLSLQPGQSFSEPNGIITGGTFGGTLQPGETPFGDITQIFQPLPSIFATTKTAADSASASLTATSTGATDVTSSLTDLTTATDTTTTSLTTIGTSTAGLSNAALNAGNAMTLVQAATTDATSALATIGTASIDLTGVLSDSAEATETALTGLTTAIQSATPKISLPVNPFLGTTGGIGTFGGVGGVPNGSNTNIPSIGGSGGGVSNGTLPPTQFTSLTLTMNNNGTVVGQNGLQQLSQMVGNNLITALAQIGIRLNRQ